MSGRFPPRRAVPTLIGALCALLLACSGGAGGPTGPAPAPPGDENPGPPQPTDNVIAGTYALVRVNDSRPGQMVTLSNPDGEVIGLYRFQERTTLGLTEQQTWSLVVRFEDDTEAHEFQDAGRFKRSGEDLADLSFRSEVFGDVFEGRAVEGIAAINYDMDGDGQADTVLGFQRVLGPGD